MAEDSPVLRASLRAALTERVLPQAVAARQAVELAVWEPRGEPVPASNAFVAEMTPCEAGYAWGRPWETVWFRMRAQVPADWAGEPLGLALNLGAGAADYAWEGLLYRDGLPEGAAHVAEPWVALEPVEEGDALALFFEAAANPTREVAAPPKPRDRLFVLHGVELCRLDREVDHFVKTVRAALDGLEWLPVQHPARQPLLEVAQASLECFRTESAAAARPLLDRIEALLTEHDLPPVALPAMARAPLSGLGNWPFREVVRRTARVVAARVAALEATPALRLAMGQAQHFSWMEAHHPSLFFGIREMIRREQWLIPGMSWAEADPRVASAESFLRQLLHGHTYIEEHFRAASQPLYLLPEGAPGAACLPQLLNACGIERALRREQGQTSARLWEGLDGSRIRLEHFSQPAYLPARAPAEPTEPVFFDEIESASRFDGARQRVLKAGLAEAEAQLRRAELLDAVALAWRPRVLDEEATDTESGWGRHLHDALPERSIQDTHDYPEPGRRDGRAAALDRAWKLLLVNQSPAMLSGHASERGVSESLRDFRVIRELSHSVRQQACDALRDRLHTGTALRPALVVNPLAQARREVGRAPDGRPRFFSCPPCGYAVSELAEEPYLPRGVRSVEVYRTAEAVVLENGLLRVTVGRDGSLSRIYDEEADRELVPPGETANALTLVSGGERRAVQAIELVELREELPFCASVVLRSRVGDSLIEQAIELRAGSRRLDFHTRLDWREPTGQLRVVFPVAVRHPFYARETLGGHLWHSTRDARPPVGAGRWVDLSEANYGVALLGLGCAGAYVEGARLCLPLIGSDHPTPEADHGKQHFSYALLPHPGSLAAARIPEQAREMQTPLECSEIEPCAGDLPAAASWLTLDRPGVLIEALKVAESGEGLVLRLSEQHGARGGLLLRLTLPVRAVWSCDPLERPAEPLAIVDGVVELSLRPFENRTLFLALA